MKKSLQHCFITCAFLFQVTMAQAYQPYAATVVVDTSSATVHEPNLVDLSRSLKSTSLELLIPVYTPTSPVAIGINLRGIDLLTSFAANSTTLVVEIPQAGITQSFTGSTRDESLNLLRDFIRNGGTKHKLLKAYAKYSPIDPIAGNPTSLMSQMAQSDYALGRLSPLAGCNFCWSSQPIVHQFQAGLDTTRAFSDPFDTTAVSLPLRYSYSPNLEWAFILDAPITFFANGGAYSIVNSIGVGLWLPITQEWSLTPIIRGGAGGSLDLCTSGTFLSSGLTSEYNYKICDYVLSMTNYAGYIFSGNFWLTGVNFNYHLHNYIFKNGLSLTSCEGFTLCDRPINFSLSFVDTCFAKDRLFINHYDEVGFSLFTTNVNPCLDYDCLSIGFAYQFGKKSYKGYRLNLDYQF